MSCREVKRGTYRMEPDRSQGVGDYDDTLIMTPRITAWEQLTHVSEEFDDETGEFQYTMVALIDEDDRVFYGELPIRRAQASLEQVTSTLVRVPDEDIYPKWPSSADGTGRSRLTPAASTPPERLSVRYFVKRPDLTRLDVFKRHRMVHLLAQGLLDEARTMEFLAKHPHTNIVRYYGCRSNRGQLTGIVLDRYQHTLESYLSDGRTIPNPQAFVDAIGLSIDHLHSLGWAHNDLNPSNILVSEEVSGHPVPILIDFGSACMIGAALGTSRGTSGWIEGPIENYTTSMREHDLFALEKLRYWILDFKSHMKDASEL